jgi:hypothetical protein
MRTERLIAISGIIAGLLATCMAAIAFSTGVTQEYFEEIHPAGEFAQALVRDGSWLRVTFSLDNLFLLAYGSFFLWYLVERSDKVNAWPLRVLAVFLFFAMMLDAVENFHILAMLHRAEMGSLPTDGEIELQYVLSAVKFMAGYFAAIILGLTYPRDTPLARLVGMSTAFVFPVVGVLVFTTPMPWAMICGLGRFLFFTLGFILGAAVYWNRGKA